MKRTVRISRRVPVPQERAYAVVNDVEEYPQFLPNVRRARVLEQSGNDRLVEIEFRSPLISAVQRSRARSDPPRSIEIEQIDGISKAFRIVWRFRRLNPAETEITADVEIEFDNQWVGVLLGPAMERMVQEMATRFERRAIDQAGSS